MRPSPALNKVIISYLRFIHHQFLGDNVQILGTAYEGMISVDPSQIILLSINLIRVLMSAFMRPFITFYLFITYP